MNISELYKIYTQSYKVSIDTRKISKGSIFFALKGDNFNGNIFAEEALKKGASIAIVDEIKFKTNESIILVDDVLKTLQNLATYHRQQLKIPIIGLTGSNGKTTTKELISTVLSKKYITVSTMGNLNNHIGVPLTLLSMTPKTEIGVVEMGANHLNEIDFLCNITLPDYGYITNFGKAHLEGFGSLEGVIKGKTELYQHLKKRNKTIFVNANDQRQIDESRGINKITFGTSDADTDITFIEANPFVILKFKSLLIKSKLIGAYNYCNIAAAISIGNFFKTTGKAIKEAIENYVPSNNRSQIIKQGNKTIILDAYNANPTSMQAALENLSNLSNHNNIAILGDMFELGTNAALEHQKIAEMVLGMNINRVYLIGENFNKSSVNSPRIKLYKTFDDIKSDIHNLPLDNSTILIKASRGMALERLLDFL